jgi:large subunit ribosomal protein L1
MKRGKNYNKALELFQKQAQHTIEDALELLAKMPKVKFDESVEVHVKTSIDPRKSDQQIRGAVELPHGTGKSVRVCVFTDTQQEEAKKAGADVIGGEELIETIRTAGTIEFDVAVATPEMMPKLAKIAKILGPKGLMPNPKSQTVGPKVTPMIEALKRGRQSFKNDDSGNLHFMIGKRSFDAQKLVENFNACMEELKKMKPAAVKGKFIKSVSVSATMTPGIRVSIK